MGSAAVSGLKAKVAVSSDAGVTYDLVTEQFAATLDIDSTEAEVTNKTSSQIGDEIWEEFITVSHRWSARIDANLINDDVQDELEAAALSGATLAFRFMRVVGTGLPCLECSGAVRRASYNYPEKERTTVAYEISSRGALTQQTQP